MYAQALKQLQIENDLRQALERQEFKVYYQPIVCLSTGRLTGFEALIRWHHPIKGLVPPADFIPIAEETGLIVPIGEWVLREACQQMSVWQTLFSFAKSLKISVNLSIKQLEEANLLQKIDEILAQTNLEGESLKLELTESILMKNGEEFIYLLSLLKARGIQMSIDDFGTGYSSLSYLHRFPVHNLKVDRSFVSRIGEQGNNKQIIETIVTLAHQLGMKAIAEGVETPEQLNQLVALKCDEAQGYLFSKPLEREAAEAFMVAIQHSKQTFLSQFSCAGKTA
jgi:EAL domain-containing protein (putative c-di-GMP-specific phosphodiesterase class I)